MAPDVRGRTSADVAPEAFFASVTQLILDLDGTLINTEQLVDEVVSAVLHTRGVFTPSQVRIAMEQVRGMRPMDGTKAIIAILQLTDCTPESILAETSSLLNARWCEVNMMPGAKRLLEYLHRHKIETALATSTPSDFLEKKMASHDGWIKKLDVITTGDEVVNGKPAPDIFKLAMDRLGVTDPKLCLVLEDTPLGVIAAKAAGAFVIAIPSIQNDDGAYAEAGADAILKSLLDFDPRKWGLPEFEDRIDVELNHPDDTEGDMNSGYEKTDGKKAVDTVLPLSPFIYLGGPVVNGFGRGSKTLGIPTANLEITDGPAKREAEKLAPGIYFGWAGLRLTGDTDRNMTRDTDQKLIDTTERDRLDDTHSTNKTYPMVMSIGWNPFFENAVKTCEPWLLADFENDFYGAELRLKVLGYIRPEANFVSLESLIERIHKDAEVAKGALLLDQFAEARKDAYLTFEEER